MASTFSKKMSPKILEERQKMNGILYAFAIGFIMYAMFYTRPDVTYTIRVTSKFQVDLGEEYLKVVKNILKCLRRIIDIFFDIWWIRFKTRKIHILQISNNLDDNKSVSRYVFTLNGGVMSYKSFEQPTVANLVIKIEYIIASEAIKKKV